MMKIRNMKTAATVASMIAAALLSGCATLDTSNSIGFPVKTKPEAAHVFAYSKTLKTTVKCVSPCNMTLRQTHDYFVTIKKKGYVTRHIKVRSEDSVEGDAGSFGQNLLALGAAAPIGMIVDGISGADDRLFPGSVNITLKALPESASHTGKMETAAASAYKTSTAADVAAPALSENKAASHQ